MSSEGKGPNHARGQELPWRWLNVNLQPLFRVKAKRSHFRVYKLHAVFSFRLEPYLPRADPPMFYIITKVMYQEEMVFSMEHHPLPLQ